MTPSVSLIHQADYDPEGVYRALREAVDLLGGIRRFVSPGERILLKPNLLSPAVPEKAITTHPAVVRAAIYLVREAGGTPFLGDSPGMAALTKAAEVAGIKEVAEQAGVELLDFDHPQEVTVPPGFRFKRIEVARAALELDGIINLAKLKTHGQMGLTLSVKNMFGCVPGKRKAQWHFQAGRSQDRFAEMLLEIYFVTKPRLNILDGILGMEGDGPGTGGHPKWVGLVAASADGPALDLTIAQALGIPPLSIPTIKIAQDRGLSPSNLREVEVRGEELDKIRLSSFLPPRSLLDVGWGIPPFLHRVLRGALTARPEIEAARCVLCHICSQACPTEAIQEKEGRLFIDQKECIRCFCCQELCPEGTVQTKQGWAAHLLGGQQTKGK